MGCLFNEGPDSPPDERDEKGPPVKSEFPNRVYKRGFLNRTSPLRAVHSNCVQAVNVLYTKRTENLQSPHHHLLILYILEAGECSVRDQPYQAALLKHQPASLAQND